MKKDLPEAIDELRLRMEYALKESKGYDLATLYISSEDAALIRAAIAALTGTGTGDRMTKAECQEVTDTFNDICTSLPAVKTLSEARMKAIASAKKQLGGVSFTEYFKKVEASDFLTGRASGWRGCGFDWVLKKANLLKVIEGNYDNGGSDKTPRQETAGESSFDIDEFYTAAKRRTERMVTDG